MTERSEGIVSSGGLGGFLADADLPKPAPDWEAKATAFQRACVAAIRRRNHNGSASTTNIATNLGTSKLAVWSALMALRRRGAANYWCRGQDRWDRPMWWVRGDDFYPPNTEVSNPAPQKTQ